MRFGTSGGVTHYLIGPTRNVVRTDDWSPQFAELWEIVAVPLFSMLSPVGIPFRNTVMEKIHVDYHADLLGQSPGRMAKETIFVEGRRTVGVMAVHALTRI